MPKKTNQRLKPEKWPSAALEVLQALEKTLVEAHNEEPPMLTQAEWDAARSAISKADHSLKRQPREDFNQAAFRAVPPLPRVQLVQLKHAADAFIGILKEDRHGNQ